jgi:iron complex transport system permease protein
MAGILALAAVASLATGAKPIPISTVLDAFWSFDPLNTDHLIVRELRLWRTVMGIGVGSSLAVAGALMQGVTRNPLADPGLLGVNAGASFAVVLAIWALGLQSLLGLVWFAFGGAGLATGLVLLLGAMGRGGTNPVRLVLAGVALAALLGSLTASVTLLDQAVLDRFRFWAVGSLSGLDGDVIYQILPFLVVGMLLALGLSRSLNAIALGEEVARSLGIGLAKVRFLAVIAVTLLCGSAVAACGPIGFVGLVVPHAARVVSGADQRWLIGTCALLGPTLLLVCDTIGRVIARPRRGAGGYNHRRHRGSGVRGRGTPGSDGATMTWRISPSSGHAPPAPIRRRGGWISLSGRGIAVCGFLGVATLVASLWSVSVGDFPIPFDRVIGFIWGEGGGDADFIIGTLRLPRVITAVLVGASLGMSGAIFQSLARNPLASPDVIGFTPGAALGAVLTLALWPGSTLRMALGAVLGGMVTASAVLLLARRRGVQIYRLVLIGIGFGFAVRAGVEYLVIRSEVHDLARAAVWLTGSLSGRTWEHVVIVGSGLAVLGILAIAMEDRLDVLALGDDVAVALGIPVTRLKLALVAVGVGLAAVAVVGAGPVSFVALMAGPIARRLVRTARASLIASATVGALLVVAADLAGRRLLAPIELPVGVFTALLGAPYLLWLLVRQTRVGDL